MLEEIVNYGAAAFARCMTTARDRGPHRYVPLFLLLHAMEMIDAAQVLISEAVVVPARIQLRSAFEAILAIDYILSGDTARQAYAWLVDDAHRNLAAHRAFDPTRPEGHLRRERIEQDVHAHAMRIPNVPDLGERIAELEELLQEPGLREANEEYENFRIQYGRRPE
jgi:hypothetical protein